MKALVAPDKFKGSLSAAEVADCLARGLEVVGVQTRQLPLADGGDGSVAAAGAAGYAMHSVTVASATGRPQHGYIAIGARTAVVEIANTCGISTLRRGTAAPLDASSVGIGQAIKHALRHELDTLVLALGGSASTDGGIGMLAALGVDFYDHAGRSLRPCGRTLPRIAHIDMSRAINLSRIDVVVASDVTNPLTGRNGAADVYGPQKGARPADVQYLDHGLHNLVNVFVRSGYPQAPSIARTPGAGSAGGVGFAAALLGARIVSGAHYFLDLLDFDAHLHDVDLVVTGEGCIDDQTQNGKLLSAVAARSRPKPVIAAAGKCTLSQKYWQSAGLTAVYALSDFTHRITVEDAKLTADVLTTIGRQIGQQEGAHPRDR